MNRLFHLSDQFLQLLHFLEGKFFVSILFTRMVLLINYLGLQASNLVPILRTFELFAI